MFTELHSTNCMIMYVMRNIGEKYFGKLSLICQIHQNFYHSHDMVDHFAIVLTNVRACMYGYQCCFSLLKLKYILVRQIGF